VSTACSAARSASAPSTCSWSASRSTHGSGRPRCRRLLELAEVERVTYLRLEFVGPRQLYLVADVDLSGDDAEPHLAVRLRDLEARVSSSPAVVDTTLSLSAPDEPSLVV